MGLYIDKEKEEWLMGKKTYFLKGDFNHEEIKNFNRCFKFSNGF